MTNTADRNLIVGLDIGTTKVAVLVGEVLPDGELNVIGMGSHASRGMEKGGSMTSTPWSSHCAARWKRPR